MSSSSLPSETAVTDPKMALYHQIERLQNRKAQLERNWRIPGEKMQELGLFLVELNRQLEGNDFEGAAVIYIKCLAFVEELERLHPNKLIQPIVLAPSNIIPPPHPTTFAVLEATKLDSNAPDVATFRPNRFLHFAGKPPERGGSRGRNGVNRRSLWNRITDRGMRKLRDQTSGARADEVRDLWNTQIEFFLSCLGFIVGGGNTLRFPAMIFEFGGIFFIPHLFFMVIFGFPLVYMHLAIGQYSGLSASAAFYKMMPIASGLGWALVLLALPVSIYYIFYVAWGFYYLWFALHGIFEQDGMIWEHCRPEWVLQFNCCELTTTVNGERCGSYGGQAMPAPEAFFYFQVLNRTMDVQEAGLGQIQEHLLISLIISWIVVFFGVFKGLGSIGWAVSITATLPYFLLVILLLRSISLEGASTGLVYLFKPELKNLWNLKLWRKAAEQVFYSLGIDAGPLISMASFSRYRNNIYRDAVLMVIMQIVKFPLIYFPIKSASFSRIMDSKKRFNSFVQIITPKYLNKLTDDSNDAADRVIDTLTSVLCGMVIFSFIGFMTTQQGIRIQDIQRLDPSYIAFTVYPGVTSYLEWGFVWAILFYIILTVSALDAEFAWLEMIAASIMNKFGSKQKKLENRLLIILCVFCFLCGIPLCTQGGIYIFHAIENMNSNWNSFSLSLIQVLIVCHAYGVDKFLEDIAGMLRVDRLPSFDLLSSREHFLWRRFLHFVGPTGAYIKWMWSMFAPIVLTLLLIASILGYERVTFNGIKLPIEYELIAWIVMIGPLLIVPVTALYNIWDAKRNNKPLKSVFSGSFRKRELDEEESKQPKHTQQNEGGLYAYIDPLSRGASAKSTTNRFSRRSATIFWHKDNQQQQNLAADDEQKYQEVRERLRRWTEEEGNSSIGVQRSLTDRPEIEDDSVEETEDETEDQRVPGRISDWQRAQQHQQVINNALFTPQGMAMQSFGRHHIQRIDTESATDTQSQSKCESPFLFGPPPQQPVLLGTYTNNKTDIVDDSHNEAGTSDNIKITVVTHHVEGDIRRDVKSQSIVEQFGQSSSVIELSEFSGGLGASAGVVVPCQQHQQPFPFSLSMHSQPDWRTSNLTRQRLKRPQPIAQRMMKKKE